MKDLNRKTEFDKHWEEVFQEAEMTPSEGVWDKIDSKLSKEEAGYFKKRAFMFKLLAAASIAFAMGIGVFSLNYYLDNPKDSELAEFSENLEGQASNSESLIQQPEVNRQLSDQLSSSQAEEEIVKSSENSIGTNQNPEVRTDVMAMNSNIASQNDESMSASVGNSEANVVIIPVKGEEDTQELASSNESNTNTFLADLTDINSLGVGFANNEGDVYEIDHIYLIPIMPKGASKVRRQNDTGVMMASLDFSAGQFNPNFQHSGSNLAAPNPYMALDSRAELTSLNATNKDFLLVRSAGQDTKPEVAYSYGANVGFKLTNRILIQTGFAYRKANTTTTTTGYIENAGSDSRIPIVASYQYQYGGLSTVSRIDETNLLNQYEFASIPVRAGYVIINRKVNLTLLAGVSSEFFINNQIVDDSNFLETLSSNDAANSPYKNVYFNGSLGTMLGYSFAKNYMITVEPSYRVAINSFTKDSFYLSSYPSSFMVSFGVAYNFR